MDGPARCWLVKSETEVSYEVYNSAGMSGLQTEELLHDEEQAEDA
jgi:hypothetical protein